MRKRKIIQAAFDKWLKPLGLLWHDGRISYYTDKKSIKKVFDNKDVCAKCWADWRYGTFTIAINLPAFKGMSREQIEGVVLHELCHVLVNEMREGEIHHEERVVTGLTKAFEWVYKAGGGNLE